MKVEERIATYTVKGTEVTFKERIKIDDITGEEIYDPVLEQENDVRLYNEYRRIKGLLLPNEIKEIREKFGLTQVMFGKILGFGDKTIARYENGSLQDTAQDNLIKIIGRNPKEFLKLLIECKKIKNELSKQEFDELVKKISDKIELKEENHNKKLLIQEEMRFNRKIEKINYNNFNTKAIYSEMYIQMN